MQWHRILICAVLLAAWVAFAAWQYRGYLHERDLIHETLHQQSHSVMNALVGGVRSHRRLGRFFEEQLQGMLDELVKAQDVLAVAVASSDGRLVLSAGRAELLDVSSPFLTGETWETIGFRSIAQFSLSPEPRGAGPGWGRGRRWLGENEGEGDEGPFAEGGEFAAVLLLDRSRADTLCARAAWSNMAVAAAGLLVLLLVALAWRTSVRLVVANGHAQLLGIETRYLRELGQAAAGLAHETRNPLGLIRGWAQRLAQSGNTDAKSLEHAQAVIEECDRVAARINQFLAFARPCEPSPEPVQPCQLINELGTILQPDLDAKGLRLSCGGHSPDGAIRADRELLRQALFNMLLNAVYFAPEGDTVTAEVTSTRDGQYRIEVSDRGPGVPEDDVGSLFTPYYTTRPDGTGLGLATVRRIATAHGWHAGYRSRPDGGSVFFIDGIHG